MKWKVPALTSIQIRLLRKLEEFKYQREELGFTELMEEKTKIMQETKEKLHIS